MKTVHATALRARVKDFGFRAAKDTRTWLQVKTVSGNAFGTGQLPFASAGTQLRGMWGPETILRRQSGDGRPILEDKKIEWYGHGPFHAC